MTQENNMAGKQLMDLTQQCIPLPSQSQSNHQDHQDRSSEDGASKSLVVLHIENQAERKREMVLEVNKKQYLGIKRKPRMRTITPLVKKFQFSFDWDDIEDISLDCESEEILMGTKA